MVYQTGFISTPTQWLTPDLQSVASNGGYDEAEYWVGTHRKKETSNY